MSSTRISLTIAVPNGLPNSDEQSTLAVPETLGKKTGRTMTERAATATAVAALDIAEMEKAGVRIMLNERQLLQIVPLSAVTIWRLEKRGQFPRGSFISPNKRVWFRDEIIRWQEQVSGRGRRKAREGNAGDAVGVEGPGGQGGTEKPPGEQS